MSPKSRMLVELDRAQLLRVAEAWPSREGAPRRMIDSPVAILSSASVPAG